MRKRISESDLRTIDARRIGIIKPSALGDVVQTLPLLPVLKERFPDARISWVINSELSELIDDHPLLDETIRYYRRGTVAESIRLLKRLRQSEFDLVFDLQGLLRTGVMTTATRARVRIGLESAREGSGAACHLLLPDTGRYVPAHLRYWRVAEALGMGDRHRNTLVTIPEAAGNFALRQLGGVRRPLLAVNPGARWETKRWPVEHFSVVAAKAARYFGFSTVITGAPSERPLARQLEQILKRFSPAADIVNLAGETNLKQLAAVLQSADVMLTNDSGPMHLAAGLGTPVLGIFTATNAVRSGPPGSAHELVGTELSCAGCYKKRCRYRGKKKMACLEEVSTDRVWQAFQRLIERHARRDGERRAA